jgi:hypothetical protein
MSASRRRKRKTSRNVKQELVRATTISSVALMPILAAFGFRAPAESTSQDTSTANVIEFGYSSGHPGLNVKITGTGDSYKAFVKLEDLLKAQRLQGQSPLPLGGKGENQASTPAIDIVNEQSQVVINAITQSHAENGTVKEAASKIQGIPALGGITIDSALVILMALLAQFAQKVLEDLMDDSAESTAKTLEKNFGKGFNSLRQRFNHIITNPPSVVSAQPFAAEGLDHALNAEAFAEIDALRQELSRRSNSVSRPSSKSSPLSGRPPSRQRDQSAPLPGWAADLFNSDTSELHHLDEAISYSVPAQDLTDYVQDLTDYRAIISGTSQPDQSVPKLDLAFPPSVPVSRDPYQAPLGVYWKAAKSTWPSRDASKSSSAPMDSATIQAFRNAAKDTYEFFSTDLDLDPESAEFLANYFRYRVANEALTAFTSTLHVLALQRIVDASIH